MKKILFLIFTGCIIASVALGTVTNTENPPKQYTCNGITTDFPITFDYADESHLTVYHVATGGTVTTWVQDAAGDAGYTVVSGEVIANTSPASGTLVIDCETPQTQSVDLKNNRATPAETYESALDKLTLITRDLSAKIDRAIVAPATETESVDYSLPEYSASKVLQWHPTSAELRNATLSGATGTIGTDVGDLIILSDIGGGTAGLPAVDGSQLTNIGTDTGDLVELEDVGGSAGLPAVDGSQLTIGGDTVGDAATKTIGTDPGEVPTNADITQGFYTAYAKYVHSVAASTDGGTATAGSWVARTLNTEVADTAGIGSLSSNQITLPAGTYIVRARCPAKGVDRHQARLYDITGSAVLILGNTADSVASYVAFSDSWVTGIFTISSTSAMELQHRVSSTVGTSGYGASVAFGDNIYSEIEFWKIR